jgi:hypothetical protein
MVMIGTFRIALLSGVDPAAFDRYMPEEVFTDTSALQLTRITRAFHHTLLGSALRRPGDERFTDPDPGIQYIWQAAVDLVTDSGYDFDENAGRVQERVGEYTVLIGIESYRRIPT